MLVEIERRRELITGCKLHKVIDQKELKSQEKGNERREKILNMRDITLERLKRKFNPNIKGCIQIIITISKSYQKRNYQTQELQSTTVLGKP